MNEQLTVEEMETIINSLVAGEMDDEESEIVEKLKRMIDQA